MPGRLLVWFDFAIATSGPGPGPGAVTARNELGVRSPTPAPGSAADPRQAVPAASLLAPFSETAKFPPGQGQEGRA